jgi:hypothetical protein
MTFTKNVGLLLAGAWFIIYGVAYFAKFSEAGVVLAVLGIAAGIFLILGK